MRQSFSLNQPPHQDGCIRPTASPVAVLHPPLVPSPLVLFRWSHLPLVPPPLVHLSTGFPSNISSTQLRPSPVPVQPDWFQTGLEFSSCLSSRQWLCHDSSAKHAEHLSSSGPRGGAPLAGFRLRSVGSKVRGASWGPGPRLQTWSMTL